MRGNCCICITKLIEGDKNAFAITCGHVFHYNCIRTWMSSQDTCPSCRMKTSMYQLIKLHWDEVGNFDERDEVYSRNEALTTSITALSSQIKMKNEKFHELKKQISKVSVNISSIAHNNQQLKQKNEELKEILGEMSVRKQFNNRARVVVNEKDMMIERMRYNIKVLQKKIRQENLELSDCDMDADDEAEYDENSKQFTFNELSALSLPITYYANYHANNNNIADDTDDDIANNGRDVDDDIEIVEPVSQPMPSTTTGIRYHMFEYQTRYCENNVRS